MWMNASEPGAGVACGGDRGQPGVRRRVARSLRGPEGLLGAIRVFADASGATGAPRDARTCEASLAGATAARPP